MSSKTKGWFIIAATLGAPFASLATVQGLPSARVGVLATLDTPTTGDVTLTLMLPGSYGLTASEMREGWEPLNRPPEVQAVLRSEPVRVTLPRVSYCAHWLAWSYPPPPPGWFTLRFSDAPDETYTVWRAGNRMGYVVRDSSGLDLPRDSAAWRLNVGEISSPDPAGTPERLWLLNLSLERQNPRQQHDTPEPRNSEEKLAGD